MFHVISMSVSPISCFLWCPIKKAIKEGSWMNKWNIRYERIMFSHQSSHQSMKWRLPVTRYIEAVLLTYEGQTHYKDTVIEKHIRTSTVRLPAVITYRAVIAVDVLIKSPTAGQTSVKTATNICPDCTQTGLIQYCPCWSPLCNAGWLYSDRPALYLKFHFFADD